MPNTLPPILGFAGFSGSGKTTLLEKIIPLLKKTGLRLGLIKHSHHNIEMDAPQKDSYRLRHAGCDQLLLATEKRHFLFFEYPSQNEREPTLAQCIAQLDHTKLDLILVEGFRDEKIPKIEIYRPELEKKLLFIADPYIIAIATNALINHQDCDLITQLDLNSPKSISDWILNCYLTGKYLYPSANQ